MKTAIQEKAFASLHLSKEEALNEMVFFQAAKSWRSLRKRRLILKKGYNND